ncbi:hypothetical protein LCGC14_1352270 [marine sediment metagenome]|uniref:Uncharacterized protein n=1 Tax=marine sediment metagenome TaxID=412755 RepID=A0A0F9KAJ0_9ZZZZ
MSLNNGKIDADVTWRDARSVVLFTMGSLAAAYIVDRGDHFRLVTYSGRVLHVTFTAPERSEAIEWLEQIAV